ncbi:sensor histidine kinase [Algihabitans albus]|uniref:sensor histidine kinase n=1 Tax=Algihabitans albus TaxID=2164067 RepID=UPI000E5DA49C|nr:HAMP domain-containing sensor histidine kinase [Algihabitans albus]
MRRSHSLARQLYLRLTAVVTVSFAIFVSVMLVDFNFEGMLIERASLLGLAQRIAEAPERFGLTGSPSGETLPISGITVRRLNGEILVSPDRWAIDTIPADPLRYDEYSIELGRDLRTGDELLAVAVAMDGAALGLASGPVILQIARPASDLVPIIRSFFQATFVEMWWIFALILCITLVVVRFTVERSMRAVEIASEQAAAIAPNDIDRRLPLEGLPREIEPLARRVNDALDRLERGYRAEQAFTASAAHELRTPLSVLRARIEAIPASPQREHALDKVDGMARLIGQLLQLARIETWQGKLEDTADAAEICRTVATDLSAQIVASGGDIELKAPACKTGWQVDRILLEIVVRNLIENAIRHAGPSPRIRVTIGNTALIVEDDGPGIAEEDRERIFTVFWRRSSANEDGAGIGLALVSRIAGRMGAGVQVARSDLGGARLTVFATESAPQILAVAGQDEELQR